MPVRKDLRGLQRPTAESVGFGLYGDDRNHGTAGNNQRKLNYEKVHENGQRKRSAHDSAVANEKFETGDILNPNMRKLTRRSPDALLVPASVPSAQYLRIISARKQLSPKKN